jgi:hypothetical protein
MQYERALGFSDEYFILGPVLPGFTYLGQRISALLVFKKLAWSLIKFTSLFEGALS